MKKVVTLGVLSLGVLFLAGCGQQQTNQTQPTTPAPVAQQPTQPVVTTPNSSDGATIPVDWKIYSDNVYGFSIQYPPVLLTEKNGLYKTENAAETIAFGKKETENFGGKQTSFVSSIVSMDVFTKVKDIQDIQNILNAGKTNESEGSKATSEKVTIGGVVALKVLSRGNTQSVDDDSIYFVKDNKAFMLRFTFAGNGPESYENLMISSFKFITANEAIAKGLLEKKNGLNTIKSISSLRSVESYMRGEFDTFPSKDDLDNGRDTGGGGIFLAAKVNGEWKLVFDGNGQIECKLVKPYNFPSNMISDCAN